jgi:hypothetical protein
MARYAWIHCWPDGGYRMAERPQMPVPQLLDDAVLGRGDGPATDIVERVPGCRGFWRKRAA